MGGIGDFLFGKDEKPSGPYQGPQFGQQEQMLSNAVMGNMLSQNPHLLGKMGTNYGQTGNANTSMWNAWQGQNSASGNSASMWGGQPGVKTFGMGSQAAPSPPQGFQQAGQTINGQMTYQQPNINFSQRNPYQYAQPQALSVPNIYKPQYEMAQKSIMEQGARTQEQRLAELNSRGMLTSGASNKAVGDLMQDQDNRLADLSSQYSIEQGRMGLQEQQMRRQMDMERQYQQASEIFRQSGASDEQARFLAQQSLAGFGANLQGRQQGLMEEQYANLIRRQPQEDLFRLYGMQTGPVGGTPGSPGLIPSMWSAGTAMGMNALMAGA